MKNDITKQMEMVLYRTEDDSVTVSALIKDESIWITQKAMAELFGVQTPAISKHLKNIFEQGELKEEVVISKMETTTPHGAIPGKTQSSPTNYYNLDAIISVGYRVNSMQATQFRIWATNILKEYMIKGFVMDDERLKLAKTAFGKDYFRELLERVRSIRASERRIWQQITDGIELAYLAGKKYGKARSDLFKKVNGIASVANIPEIQVQAGLIKKILHTDYLDKAGIDEFEHIRENLRNLMKYLPVIVRRYDTNFSDEILSVEWNESELENDELKNYKAKAEYYVRQHQDNIVIAKLKTNKPLTASDISVLEEILWKEVGTKADYEAEYGEKPLGEFVREIVGLDMNAAKEAFSEFLNNTNLDNRQIYFVNQIVEYIVHNGLMKDLSVLQESPFTDKGSVVEVFTDMAVWMNIRKVIEKVNANAIVA